MTKAIELKRGDKVVVEGRMSNTIDDLKLISVAEAAAALNVSTRTIIRLIAEGSIDAPKIRRRRLISISSLRQFLGLKTD